MDSSEQIRIFFAQGRAKIYYIEELSREAILGIPPSRVFTWHGITERGVAWDTRRQTPGVKHQEMRGSGAKVSVEGRRAGLMRSSPA